MCSARSGMCSVKSVPRNFTVKMPLSPTLSVVSWKRPSRSWYSSRYRFPNTSVLSLNSFIGSPDSLGLFRPSAERLDDAHQRDRIGAFEDGRVLVEHYRERRTTAVVLEQERRGHHGAFVEQRHRTNDRPKGGPERESVQSPSPRREDEGEEGYGRCRDLSVGAGLRHVHGREFYSEGGVTGAVTVVGDAARMATDVPTLQPEMLLKCWCGRWHEVRLDNEHAGETPHAREMLYWFCRGMRYYAGQAGSTSRHQVRRLRA
jgi:hypothetical protein